MSWSRVSRVAASAGLVVVASSLPSVATAAPVAPTQVDAVTGWSGADPTPMTLSIESDGSLTAAFTSVESSGTALWTADRPYGAPWSSAVAVTTDAVAGTIAFAGAGTGAAVAAWDTEAGGEIELMASTRAGSRAAWSSPTVLAVDGGRDHDPAVGIDAQGRASVGYVHDDGDSSGAFTRRLTSGSWSAPLEQSTAPVDQEWLAVSADGTVTQTWSQVAGPGDVQDPVSNPDLVMVRRLTEPSDSWAATQNIGDTYPGGLLDLAVSDDGLSAIGIATRLVIDGITRTHWLDIARSSLEAPIATPCQPTCEWIGNQDGDVPSVALQVADNNQTFMAGFSEDTDGAHRLGATISNGTYFGSGALVADTSLGDNASPVAAFNDYRGSVGWVTHTTTGDVASVRSMWLYEPSAVREDPDTFVLGPSTAPPALAVDASGDTEALWADTSGSSPTRRVALLSASEMVWSGDEFARGPKVRLRWSTSGSADRYDVAARAAGPRHAFRGRTLVLHRVGGSRATVRLAPARTTCFSSRVRRPDGSVSRWSQEGCTTLPVDATSAERGWRVAQDRSAYAHTLDVTRHRGARLTLHGVRGRAFGLLVRRSPHGGLVRVTLGGQVLGTVSTQGPRADRQVVRLARLPGLVRGPLRITVLSRHRPVAIDGVYVARR